MNPFSLCPKPIRTLLAVLSFLASATAFAESLSPAGPGPFPTASTNFEVADSFLNLSYEEMEGYLAGSLNENGDARYISQILKYPKTAKTIDLKIPNDPTTYGAAAGTTIPLSFFITYPTSKDNDSPSYVFPHQTGTLNSFEHMQRSGEAPIISKAHERFPLIILSHGHRVHAIYDISHAQELASHGYIVAALCHGDLRIDPNSNFALQAYLRSLGTTSMLDEILHDPHFEKRINHDRIGISGHSFGGMTVFSSMGAPFQENPASAHDDRITAGVAASPFLGAMFGNDAFYPFGPENRALEKFGKPVLTLFGTKDESTTAEFILPAVQKTQGPTYLIELVDQPHIYEGGAWQDRNQWELLFFKAYLQDDPEALQALKTTQSIQDGSVDLQRFEYQRLP